MTRDLEPADALDRDPIYAFHGRDWDKVLEGQSKAADMTAQVIRSVDDSATIGLMQQAVEEQLSGISPSQKELLKERFGLVSGKSKSLRALAAERNVTYYRIRKMEKEALQALRHSSSRPKP